MGSDLTHVWWWRKYRGDRKGHPCRIVCVGRGSGPRNILVEFDDGERVVAPRFAVRRNPQDQCQSPTNRS